MTDQQAKALIAAINSMQPYVPPILFAGAALSEAGAAVAAIARGDVVCVPVRHPEAPPKADG